MEKLSTEQIIRPSIEEFSKQEKTPIVLVLDNIRSMSNVGSLFRSCDAFAVEKIYLCGITGRPPHKEIHRTALGATESVAWQWEQNTEDVIKKLKQDGFFVSAIEQVKDSVSISNFKVDKNKKYALVLGNEVFGVNQSVIDLCDTAIEIPQAGTKHSLNVAVCGGIILWNFFDKLNFS